MPTTLRLESGQGNRLVSNTARATYYQSIEGTMLYSTKQISSITKSHPAAQTMSQPMFTVWIHGMFCFSFSRAKPSSYIRYKRSRGHGPRLAKKRRIDTLRIVSMESSSCLSGSEINIAAATSRWLCKSISGGETPHEKVDEYRGTESADRIIIWWVTLIED